MTNRQYSFAKKSFFIVLLVLVFATQLSPTSAYAAKGDKVTVAYIDYQNFFVRSNDGSYTGYGAEYLDKIAEYTGWKYEFLDMDWPSAYEAVKQGSVDFYCVARSTGDRAPYFDFSQYPICNEEMNIYTLPNKDIYYEDYGAFDNMRIGMLANSKEIVHFRTYAADHGLTCSIVEFLTNGAAVAALDSGDVDAIAIVKNSVDHKYKMIGNFGVSPAFMMSKKGSQRMVEFNKAQEQLYFENPIFSYELEKKYYNKKKSLFGAIMTRAEASYVAHAQPLTVAVAEDMGPFEYFNKDSRSYRGITIDLFERISQMTGLKFKFVRRENTEALLKQMEHGQVQLVGVLAKGPGVEQNLNLTQTDVYYDGTFSVVSRDISRLTSNSVIALPAGYPMFYEATRRAGFTNFHEYPSMDDCVEAVAYGKADATYIISMCENYLLNHVYYANLQTMVMRETQYKICFGVSNYCDPLLLSIMNKSLDSISDYEINEMVVINTSLARPVRTLLDIFWDYRWVALGLLVLLFLSVISYILRKKEMAKQLAVLKTTQKQHEYLKHLFETMPCGIFQYAYEKPHEILNSNAMAAKIYGYPPDKSFVGQQPSSVVKCGTALDFENQFVTCELRHEAINYKCPITRADGSECIVECLMDIVETDDRKIFQEVFIDVTDRELHAKQIEKRYISELNRNEFQKDGLLYTACFDIDQQILVSTSIDIPGMDGGISVDRFVELLLPELSDQQSEEKLRELRAEFSVEHCRSAYERGNLEHSFLLVRRRDGEWQWLRSDLVLRHNPTSNHLMCFDYVWDVTDEQVSGSIIRKLALGNCDGYMSIDVKTKHCLQYHVLEDGSTPRSLATYGVDDDLHQMLDEMKVQDGTDFNRLIRLDEVLAHLETDESYQVFAVLTDKAGKRIDKSLRFFYLDPKLSLIAVAILDVTEVRRDEVLHAELLSNALAAAEKADIAKGQFLSRVSHDMRTPLNAIIGMIELAKDAEPDQIANCLSNSSIAARHLLSVINDVLDMSSIESGKLKIASVPFNFKHLLSSLMSIYGVQCKQKGLSFDIKMKFVAEDWLVGDELRVNQILMNLLGNSIKFTSEGHIWLTISQTSVTENKIFIRFEVADTGCGMSEEMKSRLFKPFEQESATTANKYGGSGLGMSIVKSLVSIMNGSIRVESVQNQGTKFIVDLPFMRSNEKKTEFVSEDVAKFRVLAIDDEESEREYLSLVLSSIGVRYTCVGSGAAALAELEAATAQNDQYRLCLLDWGMPEMSGEEVARRIRDKYGKSILLMVISAYDYQQGVTQGKDSNIDVFVYKPLFPSSLFDLLMSLRGGTIAKPKQEIKITWNFSGKRLLLAEDNMLNQLVAQGYLGKFNVAIELAENGQIAVDKFVASEPGYYDAILMDIQMPVMDGFEATRAIRASSHPEAKTIPIIAQTADVFNEDISKALSSGMNAHVAKPISPDLLAQALAKVFTKKG